MNCNIYRSSKKDEMYVYIAAQTTEPTNNDVDPLEVLPEAMRQAFGRPTFVMNLKLSADRKLARVNIHHVLDSLETRGFFIQMPPEGFINPNEVEPEGLRGA